MRKTCKSQYWEKDGHNAHSGIMRPKNIVLWEIVKEQLVEPCKILTHGQEGNHDQSQ